MMFMLCNMMLDSWRLKSFFV